MGGAGVLGLRKLKGDGGEGFQLVEEDRGESAVGGLNGGQGTEGDASEDEFAEERGDVHRAAGAGELADSAGSEVERSERGGGADVEAVFDAVGHPEGTLGGEDPGSDVGVNGEDALGGVDELVPAADGIDDGLRGEEGDAEGPDESAIVADFRHLVTEYRNCAKGEFG